MDFHYVYTDFISTEKGFTLYTVSTGHYFLVYLRWYFEKVLRRWLIHTLINMTIDPPLMQK